MTIIYEERQSDSPYIDLVTQGRTATDGSSIRPAETCWHMVFVKTHGLALPIVVGSLTTAGVASWKEGAEILWVRFKPGTFMPHLPVKNVLNAETILPEAGGNQSFWLKGSALKFPSFDNIETFVDRLAHDEVLVRDPVVTAVLQGEDPDAADRTVRHRFQRATGVTYSHIRQVERAKQAAALLRAGVPILDAVHELGYFDQPHLTRSLKQWIGYTPAQILRTG